MDGGIVAIIITGATLAGGAIGWFFRQYWQYRAIKSEAAHDAGKILNHKKAHLEDMISKTDDSNQKEELRRQLDGVNAALVGFYTHRLRRTLKAASLPPEETLIANGNSQLQPQQTNKLKEEITEASSLPLSDSIWDLFSLATAYYYTGQYENAKETYDRIVTLSPNNPIALNMRGMAYAKLEKYYEALTDFNRSLEFRHDNPDTINNRGHIYDKLKRYDEAFLDFNSALKTRPDDPYFLYNRGTTYSKLERYAEALLDYNRAIEIRPNFSEALSNRGMTYAKLKKYNEAISDYNRSLELNPNDAVTQYNLACLFSLWGKANDAIAYLEKAIDRDKKYREDSKTDTDFDNIREDPRFKKLIELN